MLLVFTRTHRPFFFSLSLLFISGGCDVDGSNHIRSGGFCIMCAARWFTISATIALFIALLFATMFYVFEHDFTPADKTDKTGVTCKMIMSYSQMLSILGIFKARGTALFRLIITFPSQVGGGGLSSMMYVLGRCSLSACTFFLTHFTRFLYAHFLSLPSPIN